MTYEEHINFFFKNNPTGYSKDAIEATRDTKPMIMYIDDDGNILQKISSRSWRDISVEEAELLLQNNMKLIDLQDKIYKQLKDINKDFE